MMRAIMRFLAQRWLKWSSKLAIITEANRQLEKFHRARLGASA